MDLNKYRNFISNLINWEWYFLKQLKKKSRRNFLLRGSFAIFSMASILFCVFAPPIIIGRLLIVIGFSNYLVDWTQIICFFLWLWFISPIDNLSKKKREEKNKRKIEIVKAIEKTREAYENKLK